MVLNNLFVIGHLDFCFELEQPNKKHSPCKKQPNVGWNICKSVNPKLVLFKNNYSSSINILWTSLVTHTHIDLAIRCTIIFTSPWGVQLMQGVNTFSSSAKAALLWSKPLTPVIKPGHCPNNKAFPKASLPVQGKRTRQWIPLPCHKQPSASRKSPRVRHIQFNDAMSYCSTTVSLFSVGCPLCLFSLSLTEFCCSRSPSITLAIVMTSGNKSFIFGGRIRL